MHDPVDSNGGYILFTERALYRQKIRSEFKAKYGSREITCKCASPTIKKVLLYTRIIKECYAFLSKVSVNIKLI